MTLNFNYVNIINMANYNKENDYLSISWEFPPHLLSSLQTVKVPPKLPSFSLPKLNKKEEKVQTEKINSLKICPICEEPFLSHKKSHKYCSDDCSEEGKVRNRKIRDSKVTRFEILLRDGFQCRYCGRSQAEDPNLILVIDHIIPYSKGGTTVAENLVTCCQQCNCLKGTHIFDQGILEVLMNN